MNLIERWRSCLAISVRQRVAAIAVVRNGSCIQVRRHTIARTRDRLAKVIRLAKAVQAIATEHAVCTLVVETGSLAEEAIRWSGRVPVRLDLADAKRVLLPNAARPTHGVLYDHLVSSIYGLRPYARILVSGRVAASANERFRTVNLNAAALGLAYARLG